MGVVSGGIVLKLFHKLIDQLGEFMDCNFGIMDETGLILSCSDASAAGTIHPAAAEVLGSESVFYEAQGQLFQKVLIKGKEEFIVFIEKKGEQSRQLLSMLAVNVSNIRYYYEEKFDRANFIKNIITDNILPGDIQQKARELHIPLNVFRTVFLIKVEETKDTQPYEVIKSLFPKKAKDFVIILDDESIVLTKELKSGDDYEEIDRTAKAIIDTLNTEIMVKAKIGIGSIVDSVRDIGRSFKEAQTALHIGNIFENDNPISNYNNLGIGRLIYQLPTTMCKLFLKEVFKDGSLNALDQEMVRTIQKFFENNLNISETSRQLYVHRNTLVYRLDKIQKATGLDLRNFDDAITFKVSMLVKKYLDKTENYNNEFV